MDRQIIRTGMDGRRSATGFRSRFEGPEGRIAHLGIMTEDLESTLEEVYKWDVTQMPQGRHWVALPDGLVIELLQAKGNSVAEALAVNPRA